MTSNVQASYTSLNLMLNSINDETRLAMLCENFAYMSNEEKAGVIFTTSDDVKIVKKENIFVENK